jgi:hypothetical protein
VPAGTVIWVASGTPALTGYTLIGSTKQSIRLVGENNVTNITFDVYRKN